MTPWTRRSRVLVANAAICWTHSASQPWQVAVRRVATASRVSASEAAPEARNGDKARLLFRKLRTPERQLNANKQAAFAQYRISRGLDIPGDMIENGNEGEKSHRASASDGHDAQLTTLQDWYDAILNGSAYGTSTEAGKDHETSSPTDPSLARDSRTPTPAKSSPRDTSKVVKLHRTRRSRRMSRSERQRLLALRTWIAAKLNPSRSKSRSRLFYTRSLALRSLTPAHVRTTKMVPLWHKPVGQPLNSALATNSTTDGFSSFWQHHMAKLKVEQTGSTFEGPPPAALKRAAPRWARFLTVAKLPRPMWSNFDIAFGPGLPHEIVWENAALWTLVHDPRSAARFLNNTLASKHRPAVSKVVDMLEYLLRAAAGNSSLQAVESSSVVALEQLGDNRLPAIKEIYELTLRIVRSYGSFPQFDGDHFRLFLRHVEPARIRSVMDEAESAGVPIHANTKLQAVRYLVDASLQDDALDVLVEVATKHRSQVREEALQMAFSSILLLQKDNPEGLVQSQEIFNLMLGLKIEINVRHCNILMLTAVNSGDLRICFQIYNLLLEHKLQPTEYTFAILIKGCKLIAVEDGERLSPVIDDALGRGILLASLVVANEVLDCLLKHHILRKRKNLFALLLDAYVQMFDKAPLALLKLCQDNAESSVRKLLEPQPATIGIMLRAYLHSSTDKLSKVYALQQRIWNMACRGDEMFRHLFASDYVNNTFLVHYSKQTKLMPLARQTFRFICALRNQDELQSAGLAALPADPVTEQQEASDDDSQDARRTEWLPNGEADIQGHTPTTLSILHHIFCSYATPKNAFLADAKLVMKHMKLNSMPFLGENWLVMLQAALACDDVELARHCVTQQVEAGTWDEQQGRHLVSALVQMESRKGL